MCACYRMFLICSYILTNVFQLDFGILLVCACVRQQTLRNPPTDGFQVGAGPSRHLYPSHVGRRPSSSHGEAWRSACFFPDTGGCPQTGETSGEMWTSGRSDERSRIKASSYVLRIAEVGGMWSSPFSFMQILQNPRLSGAKMVEFLAGALHRSRLELHRCRLDDKRGLSHSDVPFSGWEGHPALVLEVFYQRTKDYDIL